jgi:hypothetical protein
MLHAAYSATIEARKQGSRKQESIKQAANGKQHVVDSRQQTASSKQPAVGSRKLCTEN